MARLMEIRSYDGSDVVDITSGGYTPLDIDISVPELTDEGKNLSKSEEYITDAHYTNRTVNLVVRIQGTSIDNLRKLWKDLINIINKPSWVFAWNSGGSNEPNKYYDCYSCRTLPKYPNLGVLHDNYDLTFPIIAEAKPFARGDVIELPENKVVHPSLHETYSDINDVPLTQYGLVSGGGGGSHALELGFTRILMNAGAATATWGMRTDNTYAISVTAGNKYSAAIRYFTDNLSQCQVNIALVFYGGATYHYFVEDGGSKEENQVQITGTVPGGATTVQFHIWLESTGATPSGSVWVGDEIYCEAAGTAPELPEGADGDSIFWTSHMDSTPASMGLHNVPGDVPALCNIQAQCDGPQSAIDGSEFTHIAIGTTEKRTDYFRVFENNPYTTQLPFYINCDHRDSGSGGVFTTLAPLALGARCSAQIANTAETNYYLMRPHMAPGRYLVYGRLWCDFATASDLQVRVGVTNDNIYNPVWQPYVKPFTDDDMWCIAPLGVITIPLANDPDWDVDNIQPYFGFNFPDQSGAGSYTYIIDYFAFLPVSGPFFRGEVMRGDSAGEYGIILDTQSEEHGVYTIANSPLDYPLDPSHDDIMAFYGRYVNSFFAIHPNRRNYYLAFASSQAQEAVGGAGEEVHSIDGIEIVTSLTPRYIE